jgi:ADP-ribose pyrophosphatase YjhB (NUDIX family)
MKQAVRAIIVHDNKLLVMKRNKFGAEYYTLIGGHVEMGESLEKALLREINEETMVDVNNPRLTYIESANYPYGEQFIFVCDYVSGEPEIHPDADERAINKLGKNMYSPMWLPIDNLPKVSFRSRELQSRLIKHLPKSFPDSVESFTSVIT